MIKNIDLFLDSMRASQYAENTVISYDIHLRHFYSYCVKFKIDYKTITNKQMLQYKNIIANKYSSNSINAKLSAIKSFYDFMVEIDELSRNPVFSNLFVKYRRKRPRALNKYEKALFFGFLSDKNSEIQLAFKLLFSTGLRISELTTLEKRDFLKINNKFFLEVKNTKFNKNRLVPIFSHEVVKDLIMHINTIKTDKIFNYSIRNFQNYASSFAQATGIPFSVHMTRSTFATEQLNNDLRIDILREVLGHEDITTTMLYAATDRDEILRLGVELN